MIARRLLALAFVSLIGCSGADDGGGSTSPPGTVTCEPGQIAEAGACRPAGWAKCPDGFAAEEAGCRAIVPASACPDGQRPRLGSASCEPLPAIACPSGFAADGLGCKEILPAARCTGATREALGETSCVPLGDCAQAVAGATHFVDPAGAVDATHFTTLAAALAAAPSGSVVALASGTYKESVAITKSVTIAGRCAANVILDGEDTPGRSMMNVTGTLAVEIRGVTITRYEAPLRIGGKSQVHVVDALLSANHGAAATANDGGTVLTVERSAVRGTVQVAGALANALGAGNGADLVVKDSSIVGNADKSLMATGTSSLTVDRSLVADTVLDAKGDFGTGIAVLGSADATVTSTAIVNAKSEGVYSEGKLTMSGSVVRATGPDGHGSFGRGVTLYKGTSTLTDLTLDANRDVGMSAEGKANVTADHLVVRDAGAADADAFGAGLATITGATANVKRAIVLRAKEAGAQSSGAGSSLTLQDSFIASGRGKSDGTAGDAAIALDGGSVTLTDSAAVDAAEAGLTATGAGSKLTATGCVVADTRANEAGKGGKGARAVGGATLALERTAVLRNRDTGVFGEGAGTNITLTDVEVSHTTPAPTPPRHGRGFEVDRGASGTIVRASFVDNTQAGVVASSAATIALTDVEVAHTKPSDDGTGGRGITAQTGASATITSSAVVDSSEIGVTASGGDATVDLTDSLVSTTHGKGGDFGHGVVGAAAIVTVLRSRIEGSDGAALAFADSRASITSTLITKNAVGVFVNDGGSLEQAGNAPPLPDEPGRVLVSDDTRFLDNVTRVSGGVLPLPPVLD